MTSNVRTASVALPGKRLMLGVFAGAVVLTAFSAAALAGHRGHWHHDRHWGAGRWYAPPPVVYGGPYYAPPPVVYGPGISIHIR
jgi:hypothetical protein